jgi:hypothetical protein
MRIEISTEGKRCFRLIFPTALIFNPVSFALAKRFINTDNIYISTDGIDFSGVTPRDISKIMKAIRLCKKQNPKWCLIEAVSGEDTVIIKL